MSIHATVVLFCGLSIKHSANCIVYCTTMNHIIPTVFLHFDIELWPPSTSVNLITALKFHYVLPATDLTAHHHLLFQNKAVLFSSVHTNICNMYICTTCAQCIYPSSYILYGSTCTSLHNILLSSLSQILPLARSSCQDTQIQDIVYGGSLAKRTSNERLCRTHFIKLCYHSSNPSL